MGIFQVSQVAGGRFDAPHMPIHTDPYTKGFLLEVDNEEKEFKHTYTVLEEMEMLSISVAASRYDFRDHWSLKINNGDKKETIHMKGVPEQIFFMVAHSLAAGDVLEFVFHNKSGTQKYVAFDYHFLKS